MDCCNKGKRIIAELKLPYKSLITSRSVFCKNFHFGLAANKTCNGFLYPEIDSVWKGMKDSKNLINKKAILRRNEEK